ncbi:unnamed protein product [Oppiella nova]|uniref:Uncharacterized protein n=1 Tax=Oppiella nova TaxID=334625 RepID=A0A7R9MHF3_9ACAR|nr:unnamed protein product [Oppiella nova]CAG2176268.1 unnamed protein product [Oppiella nova]
MVVSVDPVGVVGVDEGVVSVVDVEVMDVLMVINSQGLECLMVDNRTDLVANKLGGGCLNRVH